MVVANMIMHPLSISPVKEKCCPSLLIVFGLSARNAPLDVHGWVYRESLPLAQGGLSALAQSNLEQSVELQSDRREFLDPVSLTIVVPIQACFVIPCE